MADVYSGDQVPRRAGRRVIQIVKKYLTFKKVKPPKGIPQNTPTYGGSSGDTTGVTDHGLLTGRGDDDHTQYTLLHISAASNPTINDDNSTGDREGTIWINETTNLAYISVDDTTGAAVWVEITASGGGGGVLTMNGPTAIAQGATAQINLGVVAGAQHLVLGTWNVPGSTVEHNMPGFNTPGQVCILNWSIQAGSVIVNLINNSNQLVEVYLWY